MVKNLPAMQQTRIQSLGWEDPLQKEMTTYSSILAWKIPWTEKPGELHFIGCSTVRHDLALKNNKQLQTTYSISGLLSFFFFFNIYAHLMYTMILYELVS